MNLFIGILVGFILGIIIGYMRGKRIPASTEVSSNTELQGLTTELMEEKRQNLDKLREYLKDKDKINNEDVQKILNISNATAARYCNDLEKEGLLKQVGESGQSVYYIVNSK